MLRNLISSALRSRGGGYPSGGSSGYGTRGAGSVGRGYGGRGAASGLGGAAGGQLARQLLSQLSRRR